MIFSKTPTTKLARLILLSLVVFLFSIGARAESPQVKAAQGPLEPNAEKATFQIDPAFGIKCIAQEPLIVDPVAMAFDEEGRLFVAEMRGYPNKGVATGTSISGRIVRLENQDADGVFKSSTVFIDKLRFPTSVMPYKGGLLVVDAPDLLYFHPDGVGKLQRRVLYTGFDLANIQQLPSNLQWGLDNWIYACAGGSGGTVRSVESPGAPAVTLRGRGFRFHPDQPGSLEPTSGGGQFGLAADDWQNWFTATNNQHLRQIVVPDAYLRHNPFLAPDAVSLDIPDHEPACKVFRISPFEAWRVERTGRRKSGPDAQRFPSTELVPGGYITSACSPLIYNGGLFPKEYFGNSFVCDPANNLVHQDILKPAGPAVFVAQRALPDREFLASTDTWFRPVSLNLGPDGALYILDFYREVIETPLSLPEDIKSKLNLESRGRGRIWRVAPKGSKRTPLPNWKSTQAAELAAELAGPNSWRRLTAQRLLVQRQERSDVAVIEKLAASASTGVGKAHALWTLEGLGALSPEHLLKALKDPDPGVRSQALRLSEKYLSKDPTLRGAIGQLVADKEPRVRFQLALTLGSFPEADSAPLLAQLAQTDGDDPWMQTALLASASTKAAEVLQLLIDSPMSPSKPSNPHLLGRLAGLVGARSNEKDLSKTVTLIASLKDQPQAVLVLEGLGKGMQSTGHSLADLEKTSGDGVKKAMNRLQELFSESTQVALDSNQPADRRLGAIRLLANAPYSQVQELSRLLESGTPLSLQLACIKTLSQRNAPGVADLLVTAWAGQSPQVRREMLEVLLARAERLPRLLEAIEKKEIQKAEIDPARRAQLLSHANEALRRRAIALFGSAAESDRKNVVQSFNGVLELASDAGRGKLVFKKNCSTCHRLENEGTEVGPDLLSALRTKTREALLVDILDPSREVDPRYLNYLITTKSGRVYTGLIAVETAASLTLRRADRAEDVILRSQIDEIRTTGKSLMPEELEKTLSRQDLADVIAYLLGVVNGPSSSVPKTDGLPFYADKSNLLIYKEGGKEWPVKTASDWEKRRAHILRGMEQVMGPLPPPSKKVPLAIEEVESKDLARYVQKKITFAVEAGDRVPAYLLIPKAIKGKAPAMLCLHQTTKQGKGEPAGIDGKPHLFYAKELAGRGYVALAPDYPGYGDYTFDAYSHGYASATMKGIWNHMRAIDVLQSLAEVDKERIGCIGHSLGGHNTLFVSVFDSRIRVAVTSCGFTSFPKYYQGNLTGWCHKGYMPRIAEVFNKDPKRMPFDFTEVVACLAPRGLFVNAPLHDDNFEVSGVKDCLKAAGPVFELLKSGDRLAVVYPDCRHDFPDEVREKAYEFVDKLLKGAP